MKPYRTSSFLVFLLLLTLPLSSVARPKKAVKEEQKSVVLRPPVLMQPAKMGLCAVTLGEWLDKRLSFPPNFQDTTLYTASVAYTTDVRGKLNWIVSASNLPDELTGRIDQLFAELPAMLVPAIDADSYVKFADTLRLVWNYPQCWVEGGGCYAPKVFYMETPEGPVKMFSRPALKIKGFSSLSLWLAKHVTLPEGGPDGMAWVTYTVTDKGTVTDIEVDPALPQEVRGVLLHAMDSLPRLIPARTWMREPVTFRDSLPLLLHEGRIYRAPVEDKAWLVTEQLPTYQEGDLMQFRKWVMERIHYPEEMVRKKISGNVILGFVIEKDGTLGNIKVLSTPHIDLADEVIRVISRSERWSPGIQFGRVVRVRYTLPVHFRM